MLKNYWLQDISSKCCELMLCRCMYNILYSGWQIFLPFVRIVGCGLKCIYCKLWIVDWFVRVTILLWRKLFDNLDFPEYFSAKVHHVRMWYNWVEEDWGRLISLYSQYMIIIVFQTKKGQNQFVVLLINGKKNLLTVSLW